MRYRGLAGGIYSAAVSPQVSVIVRSHNRLPSLCVLIEALLRQRHPSFEIVVVEQSTEVPPDAAARLAELAADGRVRILPRPPLGGAGARNVGVESALGDILLFIDDDDLPVGEDWIADHVRSYEDASCLGVSGRHIHNDEPVHRYQPLLALVTRTLSYDPILKMPLTYVQHDRRRIPVFAVHGTNASIRRSAWERFGGWDTDTAIEDEVSFCLRALRRKRADEYFAYDPRPTLLRNRDVRGGLDKRHLSAGAYMRRYLQFVHRILGRYHPVRVVLLYPLYLLVSYVLSVGWLCRNSRRYATIPSRAYAALLLLVTLPFHTIASLAQLLPRRRDRNAIRAPSDEAIGRLGRADAGATRP
jgi:glycosyltransferase involved in cell wall biosynthesis